MSLRDLIVLVLAVGVAAGVGRSAREVWGTRMPFNSIKPSSPVGASTAVPIVRTAGFILEIVAVFLVISLAYSLVGRFRGGQPEHSASRPSRFWAAIWRIVAASYLFWFISQQSWLLGFDLARFNARSQMESGWNPHYLVKEQLVPLCGVFALLGITIGMGGRFLFPPAPRTLYRPYWAVRHPGGRGGRARDGAAVRGITHHRTSSWLPSRLLDWR